MRYCNSSLNISNIVSSPFSVFKSYKDIFTNKMQNKRNKNAFLSGIMFSSVRILASIISYFQIGIVVRYLSPEYFGLWATISSLATMLGMFNFGFGNALINRLSRLYADNDMEQSKIYFFSLFYTFLLFTICLSLVVLFINHYIPWTSILKTGNSAIISAGARLFVVMSILTLTSIPLLFVDLVYYSHQESWWVSIFTFLTSVLLLLTVILQVRMHGSFFALVVSLAAVPFLVYVISFVVMINRKKWAIQVIKVQVIKEKIKELSRPGIQFFLIQLPAVFLMSADTVVVAKVAGLQMTGEYFLVKKLAFFFAIIYQALFSSVWACYAEAIKKKEYSWAKKMLTMSGHTTIIVYIIFILLFTLFGNMFIHVWSGKHVNNIMLFPLLGTWSFMYSYSTLYSVFLGALEKLKYQIISLSFSALSVIPLCYFLAKRFEVNGICMAWIIVSMLPTIVCYLQSNYEIKKWNTTNQEL